MDESQGSSRSGEMRNFGLLLLISLIVVLVVAFSRPLIFGKVIPAVLGEGSSTEAAEPGDVGVGGTAPTSSGGQAVNEPEPAPVETTEPDEEEETTPEEMEEVEESPQSVPTVTHLVQAGDTLTSIASQFNTSIEEIMAANGLVDPNQLRVGTTLLIPKSEE